jgi:hypothetical protein
MLGGTKMRSAKETIITNKWYYISAVIPLVIIAIIFALPLKTVEVQKTETYWDVEMKSEPYTTTEAYTETEPYTVTETYTKAATDPWVYSPPYNYPYPYPYYYDPCVYGNCPVPSYPSCPPYNWGPYSGNTTAYCPPYWPTRYYPYNSYPRTVTDTREVTKYRTVTKYRDVTKYREVPTKVLKERTVTEQVRVSIWQYLFM